MKDLIPVITITFIILLIAISTVTIVKQDVKFIEEANLTKIP